jgi:hypothetical protein
MVILATTSMVLLGGVGGGAEGGAKMHPNSGCSSVSVVGGRPTLVWVQKPHQAALGST